MNTAFVHLVGLFFLYIFCGMWWKLMYISAKSFRLFFLSVDGYAFSQEEHGVVSQSQVVRSYDTTRQRPSI